MNNKDERIGDLQNRVYRKQQELNELRNLIKTISDRVAKYKNSEAKPNQCIDFIFLDLLTNKNI